MDSNAAVWIVILLSVLFLQTVVLLFVWTLVLYSTGVCDRPVCMDTGILQGGQGDVVHPMFVWTGVLLLTPCLCGQGCYCSPHVCVDRDIVVNPMFVRIGMLLSTHVCFDSDVNPMFVWAVMSTLCLCGQ